MTDAPTPRHEALLVVEDEDHLAAALKLNLELEGYRVDVARTGREAAQRLLDGSAYDAMILDVMLPDVSGFTLCKRLRESGHYLPIVMLTARSGAEDRVTGLESGADDYLPKPFELEELLARVRSVLRRRRWERAPDTRGTADARVLRFGRAEIDFDTAEAKVSGRPINLTRLERDLLAYFARNPGRVLSRAELLANVWNLQSSSTYRTVDNFISRLRRHFEDDPADPRYFLSVRGSGYRFQPDGGEAGAVRLPTETRPVTKP